METARGRRTTGNLRDRNQLESRHRVSCTRPFFVSRKYKVQPRLILRLCFCPLQWSIMIAIIIAGFHCCCSPHHCI
ncbi:hypothetical protein JAAARDRAFT_219780 [Jaapia argillacea MUCL 33604]|uniref:Uncharacterized protein n=1 Tax=Jaapia argillacea MUCL 33604 TaxID=933084 RepID=A0A067QB74_9AGAM|nr:hypothetical protein JAAARDRAFT_219780 [Jaapia argillacea MUCL 33604]